MKAGEHQQDPSRATLGVVEGIGAYLWWGIITTLYFRWMKRTDPLELVAWRVLGGLPVMLVVVQIRGEMPLLRKILRDRRAVFALFISGLLILLNWLTFIFSVLNERITEANGRPLLEFAEIQNMPDHWKMSVKVRPDKYIGTYYFHYSGPVGLVLTTTRGVPLWSRYRIVRPRSVYAA